jgi:hypothetical protein
VSRCGRSTQQEDSSKLEEYSKQAVSLRSAEEYKKSACEDLMCDLKTLCCYSTVILGVCDLLKLL